MSGKCIRSRRDKSRSANFDVEAELGRNSGVFVHQEQLGPADFPTKIPVAKSVVSVCDLSRISNEKRAPSCLGYVGDYTTQLYDLYGEYN